MIIPVKDPKHAVEVITSRTLPVKRRILAKRGIVVMMSDAKREWKGILVTK